MAAGKYQEWLTKEGLLKIGAWARDGLTKAQIAENIGISRDTLNEWCKKYSDISDTIKKSKEVADIQVENALFEKAVGGRVNVKKAFKLKRIEYNKEGKKVKEEETIQYATEELYTPPDTAAIIFYLKNRLPDKWKDKQGINLSGEVNTELSKLDAIVKQMRGDG